MLNDKVLMVEISREEFWKIQDALDIGDYSEVTGGVTYRNYYGNCDVKHTNYNGEFLKSFRGVYLVRESLLKAHRKATRKKGG